MRRLRSAIFSLYLVLGTVGVALAALPTLAFGERAARRAVKIWARTILFGLKLICGISHRIEGAENIPRGGALVAANHQSMWETIAFFTLLEKPSIVFKKELRRIPVYGWWAIKAGCIPVDRDAGPRAIRALAQAASRKIAEGAQIVLFPEGTRTPLGERRPLQPGVAAIYKTTGAACVPAVHDSGRYWSHPGPLKIPGTIAVRFLAPIEGGLDRKIFQRMLAERLEAARPDLDEQAPPIDVAPRGGAL